MIGFIDEIFDNTSSEVNGVKSKALDTSSRGKGLISTIADTGETTLTSIEGARDKALGIYTGASNDFDNAKTEITAEGKRVIALGKRFQNAFGFVGATTGDSLQDTNIADALTGATVVVEDGRSSYEEFTLTSSDQTIKLKFGYSGLIKQVEDVFAPPPLVSFKKGKRIDETVVSSNDENGKELQFGQVVEYYGRKPVEISIRGVLVDMVNHQYPSDKVKQLMSLFDYNGSWEVEGDVFADHGIKSIYFMDMDDAPVQGYMDTWSFTLEARSIKPVEYFLTK